jgi:DNA-binding CsgD family transcriptional regulator
VVTEFAGLKGPYTGCDQLSRRENEILELMAGGLRYKEIGAQLFISTETVRTHIRNIYEKLQVASRTEALKKAGII